MIQLNDKNEVKALRRKFPGLHIVRTVHKYYVDETKQVLDFLKSMRSPQRTDAYAG